MAVANDIGESKNIHPRNKQEVGRRLSLWALHGPYGQTDLVPSGPLYSKHEIEDGRIRIRFNHAGGGLASRDGKPLARFAIAGEDKQFVVAKAEIDGDTVVVSADSVPKPVAVRYAWESNPVGANLGNKENLPASCFRTDDWPVSTTDKLEP
jgi:sialate O-acetylesterase